MPGQPTARNISMTFIHHSAARGAFAASVIVRTAGRFSSVRPGRRSVEPKREAERTMRLRLYAGTHGPVPSGNGCRHRCVSASLQDFSVKERDVTTA